MTPTPVRPHPAPSVQDPGPAPASRARDWAEIQERMLTPLLVTVHERLDVGPGTRLLGLDCGSGLALLMASVRGAEATGVESMHPDRLALARERLAPNRSPYPSPAVALHSCEPRQLPNTERPFTLITALEPIGCGHRDADRLARRLTEAAHFARPGARVVLTGWGPPERCAATAVRDAVLRRTATAPVRADAAPRCPDTVRSAARDDLESVAEAAALRPDGSGRVACPFGYPGPGSALRGLRSTALFDAPAGVAQARVDAELALALRPYHRPDGSVWLPNVFRYLIARIP